MTPQSFRLEHQCSQCGAPVELDESDRILDCPYCRTRLYIHFPEFGTYYFPPRIDPDGQCFYVPYWRFKGARYFITKTGTKSGLVDQTRLAVPSFRAFGYTLGFRTQTMKMRFVNPGMSGRFLAPELTKWHVVRSLACLPVLSQKAKARRSMVFSAKTRRRWWRLGAEHRRPIRVKNERNYGGECGVSPIFVGELVSLIYAPFFLDGYQLFDALSGEVVRNNGGLDALLERLGGHPTVTASFLPMICPECGRDMEGESDSLVASCGNCRSLWTAESGGLTREACFFAKEEDVETDLLLPFRRMSVTSHTLVPDIHPGGVPSPEMPGFDPAVAETGPTILWAPAFKIRPDRYIRLAQSATHNGHALPVTEEWPEGKRYAVTLPASEAFETAPIVLQSRNAPHGVWTNERFTLRKTDLVFVPFQRIGREYHQPTWGATIHENLLRWGRGM
ncbi:MAG: hypothetical protein GF344_15100 [Chitinivibrionales bacterium]|nr:hypothetical protein [Chitinivibrionales bacterium]MBD3358034.1 hypothetical protein [Chitinivibrionales bacterium]